MDNGKYVILTIDDDQDVLQSLKTILEANGYVVVAAASAEEGLRLAKQRKPDLVFVDLMMEEVDAGANFVKEFLVAGGGKVPVYMLSSLGDNLNLARDYRDMGLTGLLQKPVSPAALIKLVKAKLK